MKKVILILTFISAISIHAQRPEPVHSFVRERHEISWYEIQQKLWKEETNKNKSNGEAWYNYFRATRALAHLCSAKETDPLKAQEIVKKYSDQCTQLAEEFYKINPNSFEANLIMGLNGELSNKDVHYIKRAYEINPTDVRTFDDLMIHNQIIQNKDEFEKFAVKMFEYNEIPSSILNWAYNILSELDENAILFTGGDNDTYACWITQEAKKFRKDVQIINTSMMLDDDFRNLLFKNMGIAELKLVCSNPKSDEEVQENQNKIVQHLIDSKKPVYVSSSVIQSFETKWGDDLFLTGLAYKYSKVEFDNSSIIRRNYEKRYLLDHIKQTFAFNIGDKISDEFNSMYLPSMLKLYKGYQESEELFKMKELEEYILLISEKSGQQSEVFEVLKDVKFTPTLLTTLLDVKELEKSMISITEKVSMNKYEVSNGDYSKFLENLKRSNQMDLYKTVLFDSTNWEKQFQFSFRDPMAQMYHWHPAYKNYPIVNVSYESAIAYCEWLTKQYNLQRNREYTQVKFRLPTEKEWLKAATSGNEKQSLVFKMINLFTKTKIMTPFILQIINL
jgi:hypothetical protein